jgi:Protein of unknown function (DUF3631)
VATNWQVLLSLAALAGSRWPQPVKEAALASLKLDQQESVLVALLDGIKRAFGEQERLATRAMLDFLLADDEHDWTTANSGRPINDAFLRERLRGVIAPAADGKPGSEQWRSGRVRERGYSSSRFLDAWQRYLPSKSPKTTRDTGDTRDTSTKPHKGNGKFVTDTEASNCDAASHPGQGSGSVTDTASGHTCAKAHPRRKKPTKSKPVTDGTDVTGDSRPNGMAPAAVGLGPGEELL